jgi:hypothetical protein
MGILHHRLNDFHEVQREIIGMAISIVVRKGEGAEN